MQNTTLQKKKGCFQCGGMQLRQHFIWNAKKTHVATCALVCPLLGAQMGFFECVTAHIFSPTARNKDRGTSSGAVSTVSMQSPLRTTSIQRSLS